MPVVRTRVCIFVTVSHGAVVHAEDEGLLALVMLCQARPSRHVDAIVRYIQATDNLRVWIQCTDSLHEPGPVGIVQAPLGDHNSLRLEVRHLLWLEVRG